MAKDKDIFSALNECNTKKIFVGDDRSLSVVGSGTVQVDNGHFNDVLCVPSLSCNLLSVYQITYSGEGKTIDFSPHQFVIKNLNILSMSSQLELLMILPGCKSLTTLCHHIFH